MLCQQRISLSSSFRFRLSKAKRSTPACSRIGSRRSRHFRRARSGLHPVILTAAMTICIASNALIAFTDSMRFSSPISRQCNLNAPRGLSLSISSFTLSSGPSTRDAQSKYTGPLSPNERMLSSPHAVLHINAPLPYDNCIYCKSVREHPDCPRIKEPTNRHSIAPKHSSATSLGILIRSSAALLECVTILFFSRFFRS